MSFIAFIFIVFGSVEIIIKGKPTAPLRWLFKKIPGGEDFIKCPLCLGFWVGMLVGYFYPSEFVLAIQPFPVGVFASGLAGGGGSYFLHQWVNVPSFDD